MLSELMPRNYNCDPEFFGTVLREAGKSKEIRGLTILDDELFVVSECSSEIEVYSSMELSLSRLMKLNEVQDPIDLASSSRNKSLYIMDRNYLGNSVKVKRVDPNGQFLCKWDVGKDYGRLSVADDSNVILAQFYVKKGIMEFSPDGYLIRIIKLPDAVYPLHAVKLSNDRYLVSHGFSDLHSVCIVDANGNVEKSFTGRIGLADQLLSYPTYLAVDRNGYVMVVDQTNCRVLLLDSNLKFIRELISANKHGLRRLHAIALDEPNSRLCVADNIHHSNALPKDGRILIFDF